MTISLDRLTIKGFKSIQSLEDFELTNLNVLIGGNGAGKSNLIGFFRLLREVIDGNFNDYIRDSGGVDDLLFNGPKITEEMKFELRFGDRGYRFTINPGIKGNAALKNEARYYEGGSTGWWEFGNSTDGNSRLVQEALGRGTDSEYSTPVYYALRSWKIYHFHDTSRTAGMRRYEIIQDNRSLRSDASNIAPYLLRLKNEEPETYQEIVETVRLAIPFFDDFLLDIVTFGDAKKVCLSWKQKGSDYPMQPYHLSDGSIRFICLTAALVRRRQGQVGMFQLADSIVDGSAPPSTIIIDEPELGLHPFAIGLLAELLDAASAQTQVVVSTQSPALVDCFDPKNVIVVNRKDGASEFQRLKSAELSSWLEDYSLGDLWRKNVVDGGPTYE